MSFPFRRRDSSPRTPDEFNSGITSPGGISIPPLWKGTRRRLKWLDPRKAVQALGIFIGAIVFIALIEGLFQKKEVHLDRLQVDRSPTANYFVDYEGGLDCRLSSTDLYFPPVIDDPKKKKELPYCKTRPELLQALSGGGRWGFDEPYIPRGCHYKWYSTLEICMILERFDGVVFVGDDMVAGIYAAFNMLLRRNLALGALEQWRMEEPELDRCRCKHQYTLSECSKYWVSSSEEVTKHDHEGSVRSPYICNRCPHFFFPVSGIASPDLTAKFRELLEADPHSWKPVAIIHSLGLSTGFSWQTATESMDEWLSIADSSGRNTPFLWLGANAAGHLKPPSKIMQEGNNALWHYNINLGNEARRRGVEALNFYNMTLQASSYDGSSYDERVSLTQAMMIINWLSRLETT